MSMIMKLTIVDKIELVIVICILILVVAVSFPLVGKILLSVLFTLGMMGFFLDLPSIKKWTLSKRLFGAIIVPLACFLEWAVWFTSWFTS